MLNIACLVPHSPLLLPSSHGSPAKVSYRQTHLALEGLVQLFEREGITAIVSIGAHPRFERDGFSAYISRTLQADFSDFGDLASHLDLKPAWGLYHALREAGANVGPIVHPIEDARLDYAHGVPLFCLSQTWPRLATVPVLAINDHPKADRTERAAFADALSRTIDQSSERCAIICSGDLATLKQGDDWETIKQANTQTRYELQSLAQPTDEAQALSQELCLAGPAAIARTILEGRNFQMQTETFEHVAPTSFVCLSFAPKLV